MPIVAEALGPPSRYGKDRLFVGDRVRVQPKSDMAGKALTGTPRFVIGAAADPGAKDLDSGALAFLAAADKPEMPGKDGQARHGE